jgi:hypothetical protein
MWQQIIVALVVIAALAHFCTKYLPAALRRRIVYFLAKRGYDQAKAAKLFNTTSGCGDGCSSCGSCETTPAAPSEKSASSPASSSTSTPLKRVIKLHVRR